MVTSIVYLLLEGDMHEDKGFKIENRIREFNSYIHSNIPNNIPKVHRDLRIRLLDESYNLLHYMYEAEFNKGNIRSKNINEMLVTIALIDYCLDQILTLGAVSHKKMDSALRLLAEIKLLSNGWKKSMETNEEKKNY